MDSLQRLGASWGPSSLALLLLAGVSMVRGQDTTAAWLAVTQSDICPAQQAGLAQASSHGKDGSAKANLDFLDPRLGNGTHSLLPHTRGPTSHSPANKSQTGQTRD